MGEFLERGLFDSFFKYSLLDTWQNEPERFQDAIEHSTPKLTQDKEVILDTDIGRAVDMRAVDIKRVSPAPTLKVEIADYLLVPTFEIIERSYREQAAKPLYKPDLKDVIMPLDLLEASIMGIANENFKTELKAKLDGKGRVEFVEVVNSSGVPLVDVFCMRYLEKWRFQPLRSDEPQWVNVNINLDLGKIR
jgi:TonB family protein